MSQRLPVNVPFMLASTNDSLSDRHTTVRSIINDSTYYLLIPSNYLDSMLRDNLIKCHNGNSNIDMTGTKLSVIRRGSTIHRLGLPRWMRRTRDGDMRIYINWHVDYSLYNKSVKFSITLGIVTFETKTIISKVRRNIPPTSSSSTSYSYTPTSSNSIFSATANNGVTKQDIDRLYLDLNRVIQGI